MVNLTIKAKNKNNKLRNIASDVPFTPIHSYSASTKNFKEIRIERINSIFSYAGKTKVMVDDFSLFAQSTQEPNKKSDLSRTNEQYSIEPRRKSTELKSINVSNSFIMSQIF